MATYDIVLNIAKGRVAELAALAAANDALIAVPLETSGIVAVGTMRDYADLNTLLAGSTNEQVTMGRKTLTSVTVTVDNTNDRTDVDAADVTWTAVPAGNAISATGLCHDLDTTSGTDSNIIPMLVLDSPATPAGGDITLQFAAAGFYRAT